MKLKAGFDRCLEQSVEESCAKHFDDEAREVEFRQGAKGKLTGRFWARRVWTWDAAKDPHPRMRILLVRQDESGDVKYSLTNLPQETRLARLAYVQNQRFWIEHAFHEAKSQLGMAQYQARVWPG